MRGKRGVEDEREGDEKERAVFLSSFSIRSLATLCQNMSKLVRGKSLSNEGDLHFFSLRNDRNIIATLHLSVANLRKEHLACRQTNLKSQIA